MQKNIRFLVCKIVVPYDVAELSAEEEYRIFYSLVTKFLRTNQLADPIELEDADAIALRFYDGADTPARVKNAACDSNVGKYPITISAGDASEFPEDYVVIDIACK